MPVAAEGHFVTAFATGLDHPRWLHVLPNGEVLVARRANRRGRLAKGSRPAGELNHHWTKGLIASGDGSRLYVSVGSNGNVAEKGMGHEANRAAILEIDRTTGRTRLFAPFAVRRSPFAVRRSPFAVRRKG
jgi:glucose/arabinose dehydrogenase